MRIVVAPDSFKGSLSAAEVARALARGLGRALPGAEVLCCPVADGGEGTAEVLCLNTGGRMVERTVTGPLGEPVRARFAVLGGGETAVVEIAAASGLPLVPPARRDPMVTTSYGTGELIVAAIEGGCRRVMVALGGSATVDGGLGMLEALGFRHLDAAGQPVPRGGRGLGQVATALRPEGSVLCSGASSTLPAIAIKKPLRLFISGSGTAPFCHYAGQPSPRPWA
ncbi:MAG: glycerate kinase, partial [Firmicutes bacterium]|nr:glycerate kinase [Bacillota bacterium]